MAVRRFAALIDGITRPTASLVTTFLGAYFGSSVVLYLEGTLGSSFAAASPIYAAALGLILSILIAPPGRILGKQPERFARPLMARNIGRQSASAWIFGGFIALATFRNVPPPVGSEALAAATASTWIQIGLFGLALVVAYLKVALNWAAKESAENPASGPALAATLSVAAVWTSALAASAAVAVLAQIPPVRAWCEPLLTLPEEKLRAMLSQRNYDLARISSLAAVSARMACVPIAVALVGAAISRAFPAIGTALFGKVLEAISPEALGMLGMGGSAPARGAPDGGPRVRRVAVEGSKRLYGRFLVLDEVGGGATCAFYRAWDMKEGRPCGVKVADSPLDLEGEAGGPADGGAAEKRINPADCLREIVVSLACPPVSALAGFHEVFLDGDRLVSVVEYVPGPTLYRLFKGAPRTERLDDKLGCLVDIAMALEFYRSGKFDVSFFREFDVAGPGRDMYHGDLHSENVIIRHDGHPTLIDWGASYRIGEKLSLRPSTAPEFLASHEDHARLGSAVDVYSLGAMLWNLAVSEVPFGPGPYRGDGNEVDPELIRLRSFNAPDRPVPEGLLACAERMLSWRAGDRPSMKEVIGELKRMMGRPHVPGLLILAAPGAEDLGRIMGPRLESAAAFLEDGRVRPRLDKETVERLADLLRRAGNAYLGGGARKMTERMTPFLDPRIAALLSRESMNGMKEIDAAVRGSFAAMDGDALAPVVLALRGGARDFIDGGAGNFWDALFAALIPRIRAEAFPSAAAEISDAFIRSGDDPLCLKFTLEFLEKPEIIRSFPAMTLKAGLLIERIIRDRAQAVGENRWISMLSRARLMMINSWISMREGGGSAASEPALDGDRLVRDFESSVAAFAACEGRGYSDFSFLLMEGRTLFFALSPAPRSALESGDPAEAARRTLEAMRRCVDAWGIPSYSAAVTTGDLYAAIGSMADTGPSAYWDRMHALCVALFHGQRETFFTLPFSCLPADAPTGAARALYLKWRRRIEARLPADAGAAARDIDEVLGCTRRGSAEDALAAMRMIEARGSEAPGLVDAIPACRLNALYLLDREAEMLSLGYEERGNGGDALAYALLAKAALKAGMHDRAIQWDRSAMDRAMARGDWRNYLDALLHSRHAEHDLASRAAGGNLPAQTMFDSLATWTDSIARLCKNELPDSCEKVHAPVFESFRSAFPRARGK